MFSSSALKPFPDRSGLKADELNKINQAAHPELVEGSGFEFLFTAK
jgi:hypothetical protein